MSDCPLHDEECQPSCPWYIEQTPDQPGGCAVTVMARRVLALSKLQASRKPRLQSGETPR